MLSGIEGEIEEIETYLTDLVGPSIKVYRVYNKPQVFFSVYDEKIKENLEKRLEDLENIQKYSHYLEALMRRVKVDEELIKGCM